VARPALARALDIRAPPANVSEPEARRAAPRAYRQPRTLARAIGVCFQIFSSSGIELSLRCWLEANLQAAHSERSPSMRWLGRNDPASFANGAAPVSLHCTQPRARNLCAIFALDRTPPRDRAA
jgi:hypothetical protein